MGATITSGPSPVGVCVMKSSFIFELSLTTSSTVIPVSSLKSSTTDSSGFWRFWSTHMVMVAAPASVRSWPAEDDDAAPWSEPPAAELDADPPAAGLEEAAVPPPPHAVSARAENAAVSVRPRGRRRAARGVVDVMMCLSRYEGPAPKPAGPGGTASETRAPSRSGGEGYSTR